MSDNFQSREERRRSQQQQNKKSRKSKKTSKKSTSIWKRILLVFSIIVGIGIIAGGATFAYFVSTAPELDEALLKDPVSSKIYSVDEDGKKELIQEVGKENRDYVKFEEIPQVVVDAVLATEDSRFYSHHGVDVLRLGSAVIANFTDGFGSQGASTITQQLVKKSFLTDEKTLKRKAQELWLSFQIERKYSKEEIFEMYINKIFYGATANGIATAADTYFDKELKELTLDEAATLAGLPQSPSRYNPFNYPERAEKRRNVVLSLMNKHGYISESEMKEAQSVPIEKRLVAENERKQEDTDPYDAFVDQVIKEVEEKTDYNIFTDGLQVYTTMDFEAQNHVYDMLNSPNSEINFPSENLQAGVTLLDTQTGEIKAIGGGRNKNVKRGFNYATQLERQPGSTIKPILDYGPAIEYENWSTYEQVVDEPYTYSNGTKINNYNNRYQGQMSAREALAKSLNIPALKAFQAAGKDNAQEFGEKLGLDFKGEFEEAYSIGGMKTGFSPMEMAGAYSAFGNEGIYNEPHAVTKIVLGDKTTEIDLTPEPVVAMKDSTAFMVSDMLTTAITSGTGTVANVPGLPVAGKTGTTNFTDDEKEKYNHPNNGVPDSWFVGYTTKYTAAVWAGYDKRSEYLGTQSQKIPQRIFKSLMSEVSEDVHTKDFKKPNSVVKAAVEKGSNPAKKPSKFTPESNIVYEYFVEGTEPTQVSKTYRQQQGPTNFNATYDPETKNLSLTWNYNAAEDEEQKPVFELKGSIDNGAETTLTTTSDMAFTIANPTPESVYKFSLIAVVDDQKSKPVTVSIKIPKEEEEDEEEPAEIENPDDENQDSEQQNPGDGGTITPPEDNNQNPGTTPGEGNGSNNGNGNGENGGNGNNSGTDTGGNGNGNGENNGNTGQTPPPDGNGGSTNQSNAIQSIMFFRPSLSNFFSNLHFF